MEDNEVKGGIRAFASVHFPKHFGVQEKMLTTGSGEDFLWVHAGGLDLYFHPDGDRLVFVPAKGEGTNAG